MPGTLEKYLTTSKPRGALDHLSHHQLAQPIPPQVDILVDDVGASRLHAALVHHRDGRLFLIDLKSSHGTVVDGKPVPAHKPVAMNDGSEVLFGRAPQVSTLLEPTQVCCRRSAAGSVMKPRPATGSPRGQFAVGYLLSRCCHGKA